MATNYNAPTTSSTSYVLELPGAENYPTSVLELTGQAKKRGRKLGSKKQKRNKKIASINTIKYIKFILSFLIWLNSLTISNYVLSADILWIK